MATLKQAEAARRKHADRLAEAGVHAVGVESGEGFDHEGYVVVAHVEPGADLDLPESLAVPGSKARVPLVVQRGEMFRPQSL